jgi:membrane peptidoglycan carboxypeptidase
VGITPQLAGTVWIGFDRRQRILRRTTGGELAAPVWGRIMRAIGAHADGWPIPAGIERHLVTAMGAVVGEGCPADSGVYEEFFLAGTAPLTSCWVDPYLAYADTLGVYSDSIWADYERRRAEEESWWERLRRRVFGRDTLRPGQVPPDSPTALPDTVVPRPDSVRPPPDSMRPRPDTLRPRPDTLRPRPDTMPTRPDTLRTRPDTLRARPDALRTRPDTLRARQETVRLRPDTLSTRPDTMRAPDAQRGAS